MSSIAI